MRALYVLAICALATIGSAASAQEIDWKKVDEAIGRSAAVSGDVHRYGFPRTDLTVTLDGVTIKPALALGGWTAFKPVHGGAMVMGDVVLLETEIDPVMAKLIENGIEITAVHNHVLRGNPVRFRAVASIFRTIQVCLNDLPAALWQLRTARLNLHRPWWCLSLNFWTSLATAVQLPQPAFHIASRAEASSPYLFYR
jgi:hypothetical protein